MIITWNGNSGYSCNGASTCGIRDTGEPMIMRPYDFMNRRVFWQGW